MLPRHLVDFFSLWLNHFNSNRSLVFLKSLICHNNLTLKCIVLKSFQAIHVCTVNLEGVSYQGDLG